jgi:antitoxin (DNA-binding transcriptional repressor) of toxin-antitoxin stability system
LANLLKKLAESIIAYPHNSIDINPRQTNLVIMKVKVGQLKTHLSRYLKDVKETGESIEVCVREDTVAYLTPSAPPGTASLPQPDLELARQLKADGISVTRWGHKPSSLLRPGKCTAPAKGSNSVESIRAEKNW